MGQDFGGRIGRDWRDSEPWWPPEPQPPDGAPNVLLVVLDDVGYAQLGCYGSDIETPVLDGLAARGVRLANFHTTSLCSPTRACLLTGRNHHRSGMGRVADLAVGFPGYWGKPPRENGYLSEILRATGYATYAVGKWHLSPEDETNMAASRATWPLGRGFERWYGFHGGETQQFRPALYSDNHAVRAGASGSGREGYHLTEDLANHAIEFIGDLRAVDADKPFFLYFATGACHSPHQPPPRWREHYRGRFDLGWKREVHEGGVADPCIIAWAGGTFGGGGIRHQFAHAIDVLPTVAELAGVALPDQIDGVSQSAVDGASFGYLLGSDAAGEPGRHETQYFEMFGSRAIYHNGWKAVTFHPVGPLYDDQNPNDSFDDDVWELYHVADDLSETRDRARDRPELLEALIELWWREARRNQVLPLDNRALWALVHPKPDHRRLREVYRYFPGGAPVPESVAVNIRNRSHALVVDIEVSDPGRTDGVLIALGSALGGWSLHVLDGKVRYVHNLYGKERHVVAPVVAVGARGGFAPDRV